MRDYMQLPKGAMKGSQSSWFTNAWLIEKDLRQKYMVGFIVSVTANAIMFVLMVWGGLND